MRYGFVGGGSSVAGNASNDKVGLQKTCHKVAPSGATFF